MRQIVLDTETTGLSPKYGHKLTEIGCVELVNRKFTGNSFQTYLNPERALDARAAEITGLTAEFLQDKPSFAHIVDDFLEFIGDAELIIHNAPFDLSFLDSELTSINHRWGLVSVNNQIIDTLIMAREMHPGQRNSLDALCSRYKVDNTKREVHGALIDSKILARVYLAMTAGQIKLELEEQSAVMQQITNATKAGAQQIIDELPIIRASAAEIGQHEALIAKILED